MTCLKESNLTLLSAKNWHHQIDKSSLWVLYFYGLEIDKAAQRVVIFPVFFIIIIFNKTIRGSNFDKKNQLFFLIYKIENIRIKKRKQIKQMRNYIRINKK